MLKKILFFLVFALSYSFLPAQKMPEKVQKPESWLEGFSLSKEAVGFQQSYLYAPCPDWLNINKTTTWDMAVVPRTWESNFATFFFLAKISHEIVSYQVKINGETTVEFSATSLPEWLMRGEKETTLEFTAIEVQEKSNLGYLRLSVPNAFIEKGERQIIEIVPSTPKDALWISACPNNLAHFISRNEEEFWYELSLQTSPDSIQSLQIEVPAAWVGKQASYRLNSQKDNLTLQKKENGAISNFYLYGNSVDLAKQKLELNIEGQKRKAIFNLLENQDNTQLIGNLLVKQKSRLDRTGLWTSRVEGIYRPEMQGVWKDLMNTNLKNGSVQIATLRADSLEKYAISADWQPEGMIRQWLRNPPKFSYFYVPQSYRHGLQFSQFLKKAGFQYLISPFPQNQIFKWASPDGSLLNVWAVPTAYESPFWLGKDANVADFPLFYLGSYAQVWRSHNPNFQKILPVLSSQHLKLTEIKDSESHVLPFPIIEEKSAEQILENYLQANPDVRSVGGERADPNLKAQDFSPVETVEKRQIQNLLLEAEKWWALGTCQNSFEGYPEAEFEKLWEQYETNHKALKKANLAVFLQNAFRHTASQIKTQNGAGIPLVVFNSLVWDRTDLASVGLEFSPTESVKGFQIFDQEGKEVPYQVSEVDKHRNGNLKRAQLHFFVQNVPSLGYKTYYLRPAETLEEADLKKPKIRQYDVEAGFYRVQLSNGGIQQIVDREFNTNLLSTEHFLANELWIGNKNQIGVQFRKNAFSWKMLEDGKLRTVLETSQSTENGDLQQFMIIHKKQKRIDFRTLIKNPKWTSADQTFRLSFPLGEGSYSNYYGVAWGTLEVGKDELPNSAVSSLKIAEQFVGAKNGDLGLVIGSDLPLWEFNFQEKGVLQALLFSFSQMGNYEFQYSLSSFAASPEKGYQQIAQGNSPLQVVFNPLKGSILPEKHSFLSLENSSAVLSSLKKAKNERAMMVRFFENEGKETESLIKLGWEVGKAERSNLLEQDRKPLTIQNSSLRILLGRFSVETLIFE